MKTAAIVVTFNPPAGFADRLSVWMSQVDKLVLIDNGSEPACQQEIRGLIQSRGSTVELICNQANLGPAAAMNRGFERLMDEGYEAAFVLDHDSRPSAGMAAEIIRIYSGHPDRTRIAIVAPNIDIPSANNSLSFLQADGPFLFRRIRCAQGDMLENVSVVITSGALHNLDIYRKIGPFREDLFIDYIDTEYCLRARQHGYKIVVACQAHLQHQFGNQKEMHAGPITMHPSFHSPLRWYYISRNRIPVAGSYAFRFPHWFVYESVLNLYGLARLVLFEDHKAGKLLAVLLGTLDGLLGRLGPASPARQTLFGRYQTRT